MKRLVAGVLVASLALQAAPLAVVVRAKGSVVAGPSDRLLPVAGGAVLQDGDRLRTGADGRVLLRFLADQSLAEIKPGTTVELARRPGDPVSPATRRARVRAGEAAFGVTPGKGRDLRFESPTTVASVRGTGFRFRVAPDGLTTVAVEHGVVKVCNLLTGETLLVASPDSVVSGYAGFVTRPAHEVADPGAASRRLEVRFADPAAEDSASLHLDLRETP